MKYCWVHNTYIIWPKPHSKLFYSNIYGANPHPSIPYQRKAQVYILLYISKGIDKQKKNIKKFKCKELAPFLHDSLVKRIYSWKFLGVFFSVCLLKRVSSWSFKYVIFTKKFWIRQKTFISFFFSVINNFWKMIWIGFRNIIVV